MHLWEVNHSYYCNLGNYFSNDCGTYHDSWEDFVSDWGSSDIDYNLLFRWDWECHERMNEENGVEDEPDSDDYKEQDELKIFWLLQRKGIYQFSVIKVNKEDEPQVKEFLKTRFDHLMELWKPFK